MSLTAPFDVDVGSHGPVGDALAQAGRPWPRLRARTRYAVAIGEVVLTASNVITNIARRTRGPGRTSPRIRSKCATALAHAGGAGNRGGASCVP